MELSTLGGFCVLPNPPRKVGKRQKAVQDSWRKRLGCGREEQFLEQAVLGAPKRFQLPKRSKGCQEKEQDGECWESGRDRWGGQE